ncbi:MAG: hypothetical protein WD673_10705 [Alphaproteobacteria bacterium]
MRVVVKRGVTISGIRVDQADDEAGLGLDQDQVEELRRLLIWVRGNLGMRLKDIARAIDQPDHTLSNFIRRRSRRPATVFLGRLRAFFAAHPQLLPERSSFDAPRTPRRPAPVGILARYGLVSLDVPLSIDDVRRVYERYTGYFFCHGILPAPGDKFLCALLHIRPARAGANYDDADLPLPRFTFTVRVPDSVGARRPKSYVAGGYAISRNGKLFLTGQHDGELQYLVLQEPRGRRFQYLHGLLLTTLLDVGAPAAMRLICQRIAREGRHGAWSPKAGIYGETAFRKTFEDADAIIGGLRSSASHRTARA